MSNPSFRNPLTQEHWNNVQKIGWPTPNCEGCDQPWGEILRDYVRLPFSRKGELFYRDAIFKHLVESTAKSPDRNYCYNIFKAMHQEQCLGCRFVFAADSRATLNGDYFIKTPAGECTDDADLPQPVIEGTSPLMQNMQPYLGTARIPLELVVTATEIRAYEFDPDGKRIYDYKLAERFKPHFDEEFMRFKTEGPATPFWDFSKDVRLFSGEQWEKLATSYDPGHFVWSHALMKDKKVAKNVDGGGVGGS